MGDFRNLRVWQAAKELAVQIYQHSSQGKLSADYGLKDQIQRSAVSISSNIAEGEGRGTVKDSVRFFYIARGSLAELLSQLEIAKEIGYLTQPVVESLEEQTASIGRMLGALINARLSMEK